MAIEGPIDQGGACTYTNTPDLWKPKDRRAYDHGAWPARSLGLLTLVPAPDPCQVLPKTNRNFQGRLAGAATSEVEPTSRPGGRP